jgi:hypothetical protein
MDPSFVTEGRLPYTWLNRIDVSYLPTVIRNERQLQAEVRTILSGRFNDVRIMT